MASDRQRLSLGFGSLQLVGVMPSKLSKIANEFLRKKFPVTDINSTLIFITKIINGV